MKGSKRAVSALLKACVSALPFTVSFLGLAGAAQAQDNAGVATLEEIIVTAQKRAENLQEVPIAITALSADALEAKGLTNVTQVTDFAPNIQIDQASPFAGSSTIVSAFVRGIGQNDFAFNMEPGVGLYVDGVYFARTVGAAVDLLDIERVEVLKGPQGTLFGRNTIGGALSVVTADPTDEFKYKAEMTTGSFHRLDARGTINVPLVAEKLAASVSFSSKERDGYQKRIPFPGAERFVTDTGRFITSRPPGGDRQGNENVRTLRGKLAFTPNQDVKLVLAGDASWANEQAAPSTLLGTITDPASQSIASVYNACISLPPAVLAGIGLGAACGPRGTVGTGLAGVNVDADPSNNRLPYDNRFVTGDIDTSYARGSNYSIVNTYGLSATLDWSLSESLGFKSITAYRNLDSAFGVENGGAPFVVSDTSFNMQQEQVSQELQFTYSGFDDRLKSVVGAYYFKETGSLLDTVPFVEGLVQVYGPNDFRNVAWALFTHNNYQLTDRIGLTFGARYTEEKKRFEGKQRDLNSFALKMGFPAAFYPDQTDLTRVYPLGVNHKKFTDSSVRLGAEYKLTDDVLAYASYAQGFKSGGWTTRLTAPEPTGIAPDFEPETADTYEAGIKSELFDRRLRLNGAVFWTDYKNIQVVVQRGISPTFENAGTGRIKGFELEAEAAVTNAFTLNAALGYLDAAYRKLEAGSTISLDDKFVNTPDWTFNVGGAYEVGLGDAGTGTLRADYVYKSAQAKDAINSPALIQSGYGVVNMAAEYRPADSNWQILTGVRNATDKRFLVTGLTNSSIGNTTGTYSRPREWFLTLRVRG
ncbi:TonB-dependent receptor [Niveispirillum lacus]|nr:TonB-dependent receptor [Niveispirillum lacus]